MVLARYARNRRIADATYLWAFSALRASPGARALYDAHRAAGGSHHQALRAVANRMVGDEQAEQSLPIRLGLHRMQFNASAARITGRRP